MVIKTFIFVQCPADAVRRFYQSKLQDSSMKEKGKYDDKVRRQRRRNRVVKVFIEQISLGMSRLSSSVVYLWIYIYRVLCEQVQLWLGSLVVLATVK